MKAPITWVLRANSNTASIVENRGVLQRFAPVPGLKWSAEPPVDYADRAGIVRTGDSYEKTDPKDAAELKFARLIAEKLHTYLEKSAFDRVILCAAPHMLGTLRAELSTPVRDATLAEIAKDLTHEPLDRLSDRLAEVIAA